MPARNGQKEKGMEEKERYDVIIVGAGMAGLSAALTLRLHGRRLARLDQYGIREIEVLEGERLLQRILLRDVLDPKEVEK